MNFSSAARSSINNKTKPLGSLGAIETLAIQIADIQQSLTPRTETCALTIFAADHGMAAEGVSVYPTEVTRQMVLNFLSGGAAANVFANSVGAMVQVVDAGVNGAPIDHPGLIQHRIAAGTQNAIESSAMSKQQCNQALIAGRKIGRELSCDAAAFGEMGIGNSSSAALVSAKVLGLPIENLVGRGTGMDDSGLARKTQLLAAAAARTADKLDAPIALAEYGGFEIVMMCGAMLAASETGRIVLVDGFIASTAALCAVEIRPQCRTNFIFGHCSAEAGHRLLLEAMDARPLLNLEMRLGEGTGALLAWPLVKAAAAMLRDMASFSSAGVSGPA